MAGDGLFLCPRCPYLPRIPPRCPARPQAPRLSPQTLNQTECFRPRIPPTQLPNQTKKAPPSFRQTGPDQGSLLSIQAQLAIVEPAQDSLAKLKLPLRREPDSPIRG